MIGDLVVPTIPREEGPAISLHLLVKNGERVVPRLLDCVGPHVSEVVAVLEDCEDGTGSVLIAKSHEHGLRRCELVEISPATHPGLYLLDVPETYAEGEPLCGEVVPGPFVGRHLLADFAAARNLGWGRCLGEWRLFLDADDVVDDPACLPGLCRALGQREAVAAASRYHHGTRAGGARERLARDLPEITWEGAAHERLTGFDRGRAALVEGCLVVRDLMDGSPETRPPLRNLKILYRSARARGWRVSPRELGYLAVEARRAMPGFAARAAELCASRSAWAEERAWSLLTRARVAEDAGRVSEAIEWCRRSSIEHPSRGAALCLARLFFSRGQWGEVVAAHERAARSPSPLLADASEGEEEAARVLLASALAELGRGDEVLVICRELREAHPGRPALEELLSAIEARVGGAR